ncbi:MAG: hypothetical protein ACOVP7_00820 [Lacibacter sp.]
MKIPVLKITAVLLSLIFINTSFSQQKIEGVVLDVIDKKPVQYALVSIKNKAVFADADSAGRFVIYAFETDILLISCTGFNGLQILVSSVSLSKIIELTPKMKILPTVYTGKFETKTIGIKSAKVSHSYSANLNDRTEFATLIKVTDNVNLYTLSKVSFVIHNKKKTGILCNPVRIHIYKVGADGIPSEELLKEDVIVTEMNISKNRLIVDISEQDITLSQKSFFVSIQWLSVKGVTDYMQPQISFTKTVRAPLTWRKSDNLNQSQWFNPQSSKFWGNMMVQTEIIVRQ